MFGWHHQLNGHESEQTPGDGEGQGSLVCCNPWGHRVRQNLVTKQQVIWIHTGEGGMHMAVPLSLSAIPFCFSRHWRTSSNACAECLLCADPALGKCREKDSQSCPPNRLAVEMELKFKVDGEGDLHNLRSWEAQALWEQRLEWLPIPGNF